MYAVLYTFDVKAGKEEDFIQAWNALTMLFRTHAHSMGSRLHRSEDGLFVAYAQWPDKAHWKNGRTLLPSEAAVHSEAMKEACHSIETRYGLEMISDLILPFNGKSKS